MDDAAKQLRFQFKTYPKPDPVERCNRCDQPESCRIMRPDPDDPRGERLAVCDDCADEIDAELDALARLEDPYSYFGVRRSDF